LTFYWELNVIEVDRDIHQGMLLYKTRNETVDSLFSGLSVCTAYKHTIASSGLPIRQSRQLHKARHGALQRPVFYESSIFQTLFQSLWKEQREKCFI